MVLLGSGAGVLLSSIRDHRETQLLDLAVVMPGLQDVGEFRVVTELAKEKEIVDFLMSHYSDRVIPFVPERAASRRDWAFQLNALQTAKLQSTKELLLKYPADQFNRLRALQNQIDRDEDAEDCNRTLKVVGMVIDSLPTSKRQDLEGMSTEQRIRFLKEQLCLRAATFYAADLQGSDADNLEQWSREILLPAIAGNVPFLRRETDAKTAMMTLNYTRPVEDGYRLENQDALIKELTSNLSPFPKRLLEGLDRSDELLVLSTWLIPEGVNNTARLLETYDRLRRETRDEIDLADPKDARRTLRERSRRVGAGNRNTR